MSTEEIQTALVEYTKSTWFKSSAKAKEIDILNVEYRWAHVYKLDCYNQKRKVEEKFCGECSVSPKATKNRFLIIWIIW